MYLTLSWKKKKKEVLTFVSEDSPNLYFELNRGAASNTVARTGPPP